MATMTIERPAATCVAEATCLCGQALELCHADHCPRCGTTLRH
jgi:hypothetical protein